MERPTDEFTIHQVGKKLHAGLPQPIVFMVAIILFFVSVLSSYWFLWQPAIFKTKSDIRLHSPVLFLMFAWIIMFLIPIIFYILKAIESSRRANYHRKILGAIQYELEKMELDLKKDEEQY
jgi:hypothetical protein